MADKQSLLSKFKQKILLKNKHIFIIALIIIACIIFVSFNTLTSKTSKNNNSEVQELTKTFDALEYASQVSQNLQNTINNVKGISNAKVVVVVSQSPIEEYLTEEEGDKNVVVYIKNGATYQPVKVTQFLPKITGILVVAKGVSNLQIKNNLLNAISAVYNVNISCIDILEGK